jgi:SAM-dependent methyltransferase
MNASPSDVYERYIQPFTMPSAVAMAASLSLGGDERVLDHGSGTGLMVRLLGARYRQLRLTALDPSVDLLAGLDLSAMPTALAGNVEKVCETLVEYVQRPTVAGTFDAVVSNYSLQFCGETISELERMRACCQESGQLRVSVLGAAEQVVPFHLYWSAAHAVIPDADSSTSYVHHKLGDPMLFASSAKAAGWIDVEVTTEVATRRLSADTAWTWLSRVLPVSVGGVYRPLTKTERQQVREHFLPTWPVGIDVPTTYHRLSARKP